MDSEVKASMNPAKNVSILIHNFMKTLPRFIWLPIILGLGMGVFRWYQSNRNYYPTYCVTATFSVKATFDGTTDLLSYSSYLNTAAASQLASTFPYIMGSERSQFLLREELGMSYIPASVRASSVADAGLFILTSTSSDPQSAYDVLFATVNVYPQAASTILGDTQIEVIDQPLAPPTSKDALYPNESKKDGLQFGLAGVVIGLAIIFLISLLRKTIHSAEDLYAYVNLKCMAYIPEVKLKKHTSKSSLNVLVTNPRVGGSFSESIRNLRIKLQRNMLQHQATVLMITSTVPSEGKTTISMNLALSLAAEGKRVILIDGDLRKQTMKTLLGVEKESDGLADVLRSEDKNSFRLLTVPKTTLLLLSGSESVDNPQQLLDSPRMKQVIDVLRERLDYIIIDTAPAGILSDATIVSKYCDATLYVVRQDMAHTSQIITSIQSLSACGANILGCVLNGTQAGTTHSGYGSKYGSKYSYGYKSSYTSYGYRGYYHYRSSQYKSHYRTDKGDETIVLSDSMAVKTEEI